MNNSEIQDKDFEINELCEKCSHLYLQHIMFGVDKINIDGACNMCECPKFVPSGKFN